MQVLVTITSDFICPWCSIGERKLSRAIERFGGAVGVVYRPFELNPEMRPEGILRRDYRVAKFGSWERSQALDAQVAAAAAEVGLQFEFGRISRTPSTRLAHRLVWAVQEAEGEAGRLATALFRAYFERGEDLGDAGVLRAIAAGAGVAGGIVEGVLGGETGVAEVAGLIGEAYRRGISGVPYFEIGGRGVSGAQPVEMLEAFLRWGASLEAA